MRTGRKIVSGFLAEAAVLIAVFPFLDSWIENQGLRESLRMNNGSSPIDMRSVGRQSAILCLMCLASAVVFAIKTSDGGE